MTLTRAGFFPSYRDLTSLCRIPMLPMWGPHSFQALPQTVSYRNPMARNPRKAEQRHSKGKDPAHFRIIGWGSSRSYGSSA